MAADSAKPRTGARFDGKYIAMGAGAYVGRIGGLAVALGIGAAVFVGHGVASAEPASTSGSESSSTSSGSSTGSSGAASTSSSEQPAEEKADTSTDSSETKSAAAEPTPKRKKKSSASQQSTRPTHEAAESTGKDGHRHGSNGALGRDRATKTADEPKAAEDPAPTASVSVSSVPKTADVIVETPKQQPQAPVAGGDNGDIEHGQRGPEPVRGQLTDGAGGVAVAVDDDGRRAAGVRQDAQPQQSGQPRHDIR